MSRHETWRTRKYWESVGGYLVLEFNAVKQDLKNGIGKRLIDGVIVQDDPVGFQVGGKYDFEGKDIIVVQTKSNRLGMYLMGQAFFSRELMKKFNPKSIRSVAICGKEDKEMEAICTDFNIEVVVIPDINK